MSSSNAWAELAAIYSRTRSAHLEHEQVKAELKSLVPDDAQQAIGHGLRAKRSKSGAISFDLGGGRADPVKSEGWYFPASFVHEQLHTSPERLLVVEVIGDSMAPTIASGERVIIDTSHATPSPDGLYAIRDPFNSVIVRRLQVLRSSRPTRVKVLSDNPKHPSEEAPLGELEIAGKVLCCLKLL